MNILIQNAIRVLQEDCHKRALKKGWWHDPKTGEDLRGNKYAHGTKIALMHSELSECLEGERKDLFDDHLPHRKMAEVELADAVIRILDYAGVRGFDVASAIAEKMIFNEERDDHKIENRLKNGKAY